MNQLGLCIAGNRPAKCCWCVLKTGDGEFRGFCVRITSVPSLHRASTDAPIAVMLMIKHLSLVKLSRGIRFSARVLVG